MQKAITVLKEKLAWDSLAPKPKIGIVLGSGLGAFADALAERRVVRFSELDDLPASTVAGHAGQFVYGLTKNKIAVLVQQGRIHYYEGHDWLTVTKPIRLQQALGITHIILTTSTGSINPSYHPGEFMLMHDHINFPQATPLRGLPKEWGERFVDMSEPYDLAFVQALRQSAKAKRSDIVLHQGVFAFVHGSQYETPAEIRALRTLGGDVVSMSTVPETIVARQCGMTVTGLANITNYGSGLRKQTIEHAHVAASANASAEKFIWLLEEATKIISER